MSEESTSRRRFVKRCTAVVAAIGARSLAASASGPRAAYPASRLLADGDPLRAADLEVGESYVFHYPYRTTPCFLIDLGDPPPGVGVVLETAQGERYVWPGGVGPKRSVVAFSAICAHKLSHPAHSVSFINYRHEPVRFFDRGFAAARRSQVIYCCSEKSVYDPRDGAKVLGGPAPQPLAAIALEYEPETDALRAVGTIGGELFEPYFRRFGHRLTLEYALLDVRQAVGPTTAVIPVREFCQNRVLCG